MKLSSELKDSVIVGIVVLAFIAIIGIGISFLDLGLLSFFGVKRANIERQIFDNTKSQIQGTIQALSAYRLEYTTAEGREHKQALTEMILLEYNAMERKDLLPHNLKTFINNLK